MPRSATTGVFTRVSNSFSSPVFGTLIDPGDAEIYFDDLDVGLNPPELDGPVRIIDKLQVGTTGTAAGTVDFLNATSGSITLTPPAGALGTRTLTLPAATDTLVGKATTDTLTGKTFDTAGSGNSLLINGLAATANTGTGDVVRATGPTLGIVTVTSINKITFTPPATSAVLTIPDGVTVTGPAASGTIMTLGNSETVTGIKTFQTGRILLNGSVSGNATLNGPSSGGGTITMFAGTDTVVGKATTDTLTNKTFNSTGTGNTLQVSGVTVSAGQYPGEPSTSNATAGNVGEYSETVLLQASATSLTSNTAKNIVTITLAAGDWDITAAIYFLPAASTSITLLGGYLSGVDNTTDTTAGKYNQLSMAAYVPTAVPQSITIPTYRFSQSGSFTVRLVGLATFTVSTLSGFGIIRARRVR